MPRTRNEALVGQARQLELSGLTRKEIAEKLGVSLRTVKYWLSTGGTGRPRIPEGGRLSERTRYRRLSEARERPAG